MSRAMEIGAKPGARRRLRSRYAHWTSAPPGCMISGMAKPALDMQTLTSQEKLELIDDLLASMDFSNLPLTAEQRSELDHRLDRLESEGPVGIAWEQVHAEMKSDA